MAKAGPGSSIVVVRDEGGRHTRLGLLEGGGPAGDAKARGGLVGEREGEAQQRGQRQGTPEEDGDAEQRRGRRRARPTRPHVTRPMRSAGTATTARHDEDDGDGGEQRTDDDDRPQHDGGRRDGSTHSPPAEEPRRCPARPARASVRSRGPPKSPPVILPPLCVAGGGPNGPFAGKDGLGPPPGRRVPGDADAGVVIMPFLETVPLTEFPGGPAAVASAAADLLVDLHQLAPFPTFGDHLFDVGGMLTALRFSGRVRSDQLSAHQEMFEEIRAVYPWDPSTFVSTHNDVNPANLLYDGNRLWLIDWESAKRNDPFIDIAQACVALAPTAELEDLVLRRVLSSPPDDLVRARLLLAKQLVRLFTGATLVLVTSQPARTRSSHRNRCVPRGRSASAVESVQRTPKLLVEVCDSHLIVGSVT